MAMAECSFLLKGCRMLANFTPKAVGTFLNVTTERMLAERSLALLRDAGCWRTYVHFVSLRPCRWILKFGTMVSLDRGQDQSRELVPQRRS